MNDITVIKGITHRNEKILREFYQLHYTSLFRFINRGIKDVGTVEEIIQDVFLDFIEHIRLFRGQSSLKTYLYSIARNKMIDFMRKKKLKSILFSAFPSFIIEKIAVVFLDDEIEKKEITKKIHKTLELLPNDYEVILRLKYIEGETVSHIAGHFSLSLKATESLLFRARKAFVKAFKTQ